MNARRQGFTIVEMLIVLVIGSIVLGAAYSTINTQERTNRQQIAIVTTEQNNRMALQVLLNELREVSAVGGDLLAASATSIQFRALRKAGIICDKDPGNSWASVAVLGQAFSAGGQPDNVLIFVDTDPTTASDDAWGVYTLSGAAASACAGYPVGTSVQRINVAGATFAGVTQGALVRSFKNVTYSLVNETVNGSPKGTLYRDNGSGAVAIVNDLETVANEGVRFKYYNASGNEVANPNTAALLASIMRIQIKVKGTYVGGQTGNNRMFTDELVGSVFLRGNRKTS